MNRKIATLSILAFALVGTMFAAEGRVPKGVPHLDHVFVIMMENHGYSQIVGNPNAPFLNQYASTHNTATNFFAVAHPSLTNYLEVVGGSNFGVHSDNNSDWHNSDCTPDIVAKTVNSDNPPSGDICPISGVGTDAETPAIDFINETQGPPGTINVDGKVSYAAASRTVGKTIADQLAERHGSYKSYQESLPLGGPDLVNNSDGFFSNLTDFSAILPTLNPPLSSANLVNLYAAKHNPFVYFRSTQEGTNPRNTLKNSVGFETLYGDLASGNIPDFSFIAPNQCNDQHGRGNAGAFCNFDPNDDGTQAGLNPALIYLGDVTVQRLVTAIHNSPAWKRGHNAIVLLWDENDYSLVPNTNQVLTVVDTNYTHGARQSSRFYTHFSLLRTIEGALGLPCLNHACDASTKVMSDLFGGGDD
ncbi:MAG TPA: alkaline phosphatase family protein [Terriglobales bacterium]|nr:alkaline phosphatase family protein [Terriglobales bacterium]